MTQARAAKLFDETPESGLLGSKIRSITGINGATMASHQAALMGNSQFSQDLMSQKEFAPMLSTEDPEVLLQGGGTMPKGAHIRSNTLNGGEVSKSKFRKRPHNLSSTNKTGAGAHLKQSSTTFVSPKTRPRESHAAFSPFYEEPTTADKKTSNTIKSGMLKISKHKGSSAVLTKEERNTSISNNNPYTQKCPPFQPIANPQSTQVVNIPAKKKNKSQLRANASNGLGLDKSRSSNQMKDMVNQLNYAQKRDGSQVPQSTVNYQRGIVQGVVVQNAASNMNSTKGSLASNKRRHQQQTQA